jgi:hypothetical protein
VKKETVCLLAALMLANSVSIASQFREFDRGAQVAGSDLILTGRVVALRSAWNDQRSEIYTDAEIAIDEVWKGSPPDDSVTVRTLGGSVDGISFSANGAARFDLDERVVIFLVRHEDVYTPWGMLFGKYQILGSSPEAFAVGNLPPAVAGAQTYPQVSVSLSDLRAEVMSALAKEVE